MILILILFNITIILSIYLTDKATIWKNENLECRLDMYFELGSSKYFFYAWNTNSINILKY